MNTTLFIAFLAGLISFLSPCVLPLIPGYISYISGTSFDKLVEKKRDLIVIKTIFFTLGFSFVFIALGSTASFIGKFFLTNSDIFRIIAGLIIIFFSLQLIGIINFKFIYFTSVFGNSSFRRHCYGVRNGCRDRHPHCPAQLQDRRQCDRYYKRRDRSHQCAKCLRCP